MIFSSGFEVVHGVKGCGFIHLGGKRSDTICNIANGLLADPTFLLLGEPEAGKIIDSRVG